MAPKKDILYVALQFLLIAAYLFEVPELRLQFHTAADFFHLIFTALGVVLIILSILQLKNLSPFPTPAKGSELVTSGPFKYVRHPIYSGILMAAFFLALYFNSGYKLIIFVLLAILFYRKSEFEEKELIAKFPDYVSYKANTGRFFPKI